MQFASFGGLSDVIENLGGAPAWMIAGALLLRSVAWSIREAGPEVRKWRKKK